MKNLLIIGIAVATLFSCKAKKSAENPDNLPKDISMKPENNLSQQDDRQALTALVKEIETITAGENCTDPAAWKFSAIGAKPCGGPASYIAYPVSLEDQMLLKIQHFTAMQSAFNKKYNLVSDCAMVMPPSGIKCENGKAVLVSGNSAASEPQ